MANKGAMATVLFALALLVHCTSTRLYTETLALTWQDRKLVASGGGDQGPWQMNESVYDYVDDPAAAIDETGSIGVVWADQALKDIFFQRFSPEGRQQLPEPVNVSKTPEIFSWLPKMVMTSSDPQEIGVLWQEIIFSGGSHGGDILFARSTDGGRTFSEPLNLSNDIAGSGKGRLTKNLWHNGSLDLARGPEDHLYAAWTEYEGTLWCSRSTDRGVTFSPPVRVASREGKHRARGPSLAVGVQGVVYLAWTVGEEAAADIHFSKSLDQGLSFMAPKIAHQSDGHSDAPKIAVDHAGTVHLVYAESPKGPLAPYHIEYLRMRKGQERFAPPVPILSPPSQRFESVSFPALAVGGNDHLFVLWELFPRASSRSKGLGFAYSSNSGQTFAEPSIMPGSLDPEQGFNGSLQGLLMQKLAANNRGDIAVVNSTFKPGQRSQIWLILGHVRDD